MKPVKLAESKASLIIGLQKMPVCHMEGCSNSARAILIVNGDWWNVCSACYDVFMGVITERVKKAGRG